MQNASMHYQGDKGVAYFTWQNEVGNFGGQLSARRYLQYAKPGDKVLDFGCAGGWVLKNIPDIERFGVEVNPAAHEQARTNGVAVKSSIDEQNGPFDLVISNHCLEHVPHPLEVIRKMYDRLKPGGRVVLVLPIDDWRNQRTYRDTIDNHLHTWTPVLIGNTLKEAGFEVERAEVLTHAWLPKKELFRRYLPEPVFHFLCGIYSRLTNQRDVIAVGRKA